MKSLMFTKLLLNKYDPTADLKYLPEEEKTHLEALRLTSKEPSVALFRPATELEKIHYSWLKEELETLSPSMRPFVSASLPSPQREKLMPSFPCALFSLSPPFQEYFLHYFYRSMGGKEKLSLELVDPTPLLSLAKASKETLIRMVDVLSVHDLVGEFHQIIDKRQIQQIVTVLKEEQRDYLKKYLHQKEKWSPVRLGLEHWNGDRSKFEQILHRRGLNRLALALKGESPDFLWHLFRRFDKGRAVILEKERQEECKAIPSSYFVNQVINAFNFVQKQ